jgi:hypothetical protein
MLQDQRRVCGNLRPSEGAIAGKEDQRLAAGCIGTGRTGANDGANASEAITDLAELIAFAWNINEK